MRLDNHEEAKSLAIAFICLNKAVLSLAPGQDQGMEIGKPWPLTTMGQKGESSIDALKQGF